MQTTFNINVQCQFELTEDGLKVFRKHYENLQLDPLVYLQMYMKSGRGVLTMPLWETMHLLGPGMYMGSPTLIKDNKITISHE